MRLKVLISAYACEPGKGSEPEVGWQWALQMARFHDVTVLTRANNRPLIEPELKRLQGKQPLPQFVYHDRGEALLNFKRRFKAVITYYLLWQRSAREVVQRLHETHQFDLMHHVTFAAFRYPIAIWGHGVPCIWGPIGGIESIPLRLLPWHHPVSLAHEITRNGHNLIQATPFHVLPRRARASSLILASTREMQQAFARLGFQAQLMPTIGLKTGELPFRPHASNPGPLKLLFVGNIITLKGINLALEAFQQSGIEGTFTFIGSGNYEPAARALAARLGIEGRVNFLGKLAREQVLGRYSNYDLFVFPSLHDTGGYAVIEAMLNELPVVCLDCGGPAVAVRQNCGIKVPLGTHIGVIDGLAEAMRWYDQNRNALAEQGRAARRTVLDNYDWDRKGEEMNRCYEAAVSGIHHQRSRDRQGYSGIGGLTNFLHRMFSMRGVTIAMAGVLLIGLAGFLSLSRLKNVANDIVQDTLPGLSYAGEANAHLAHAFNRSLMLLLADSTDECHRLRNEIEAEHRLTSRYLASYKQQIFSPEDLSLFQQMVRRRAEYTTIRERLFTLAEGNQHSNAVALCQTELLPAYERYKAAGDRLFEFNMRMGRARSQTIMKVCTITQFVVAGLGVILFTIGFFLGLFK